MWQTWDSESVLSFNSVKEASKQASTHPPNLDQNLDPNLDVEVQFENFFHHVNHSITLVGWGRQKEEEDEEGAEWVGWWKERPQWCRVGGGGNDGDDHLLSFPSLTLFVSTETKR